MQVFFLIFLLSLSSLSRGQGVPLTLNKDEVIAIVNSERAFWGVPILEYDDDLAQIAQFICQQCDWPNIRDSSYRGRMLGRLKGFTYEGANAGKAYQETMETRAASAGDQGANPSPNQWLSRADWTCADDSCSGDDPTICRAYRQVIWKDSTYIGCGQCSCNISNPIPSDLTSEWAYLVCVYNPAGNWEGQHPFGTEKDAVCAGNYTPPDPQPQPVCLTCTNGCPPPIPDAGCVGEAWQIVGDISISQISSPVECPLLIEGSLSGQDQDRLNISYCGGITVNGAVNLQGNPRIALDFDSKGGLGHNYYKSFINYTSITGTWGPTVAREVWAPLYELCAITVTGATGSSVYLYNCDIPTEISDPLPQGGGAVIAESPSTQSYNPAAPQQGGDINDPDLNTGERGPLIDPDEEDSSSSGSLPWWAVLLIVIGVLVAIALIIALIFYCFASGGNTERF